MATQPAAARPSRKLFRNRAVYEPSAPRMRSGGHGEDLAAAGAAFGAEVDDPVGLLDDVEVVLDRDDGVAAVDEAVQDVDQLLDVGEVEAGGRLVEDVERAAAGLLAELVGELDALRLAARERVTTGEGCDDGNLLDGDGRRRSAAPGQQGVQDVLTRVAPAPRLGRLLGPVDVAPAGTELEPSLKSVTIGIVSMATAATQTAD
jgi:hypothetical protein